MIGDYSIMDWVTLGGILTTIASLVGIAIKLARDNSGLKAEMKALSKEREMEHASLSSEHKGLSSEHKGLSSDHRGLSKEHDALSKEHASIKKDTEYISDEMKYEKMARENLYKNSTKAKEILETMAENSEKIAVQTNNGYYERSCITKFKVDGRSWEIDSSESGII